jgi:hypothetical protein
VYVALQKRMQEKELQQWTTTSKYTCQTVHPCTYSVNCQEEIYFSFHIFYFITFR